MGTCQCKKFCCSDQTEQSLIIIQEIATNEEPKQLLNQVSNTDLNIRIRTWQKESFSLFDYENQTHLKEQSFQVITNGGYLIKNNNEIQWMGDDVDWTRSVVKQDQILFQIEQYEGYYKIMNNTQMALAKDQYDDEKVEQTTKYHGDNKDFQQSENLEQCEGDEFNHIQQQLQSEQAKNMSQRTNTKLMERGSKIWLVVKSAQNLLQKKGVRVRVGDVIKMGRVKFKVKEISLSVQQMMLNSDSAHSSQTDQVGCRVCLSSQCSTLNPLVNPCKCSGSMKYIHLECLKTWLRTKLHSKQSEHCIIYIWKHLECELCKFNYPPVFRSDNKSYDIVELSKPTTIPYMLLEMTQKRYDDSNEVQLGDESQFNRCNGVYIISFEKLKELRLGRANETEIRVNDISVSRNHALLRIHNLNLGLYCQFNNHCPQLRNSMGSKYKLGGVYYNSRLVLQFHRQQIRKCLSIVLFYFSEYTGRNNEECDGDDDD